MASCPRCAASLVDPHGPCPNCGDTTGPVGETARQIVYEADPDALGVSLELDLAKKPAAVSAPVTTMATGSVAAERAARSRPTADPLEARLLGGFGLPPARIWEAPAYARRVKARTAELELLVSEKRMAVERAESALDEAMMKLAIRAAKAAAQVSRAARAPYEKTIARLTAGEVELRALEGDRKAETEAHNERLASIDRRAAEFKRELDLALNDLRKQGGDRASPEAKKRVEEARAKFAIATEGRDAIASRLEAAAPLSPKAAAVRKEFLLVCSDFSRFVMDDMTTFGTDFDEARGEIIRLTSERETAQKDLALHQAALQTFDAAAVQRGNMLVMGAAVAGGLLLVLLILRIVT